MKIPALLRSLTVLSLLTATAAFAEIKTIISVEGLDLPARVQGAEWYALTNYSATDNIPTLGVGISYRAESFKADVYFYETFDQAWAKLPVKERIRKELDGLPGLFKTFEEKGHYSNVKIKPATVVYSGGIAFTHTELDYTQGGDRQLNSHYYIAEVKGKVLKIRISRESTSSPALVNAALDDITRSLALPSNPDLKMNKKK